MQKSMKPRSMSRSQLGSKENRKASLRYLHFLSNASRINSSITNSSKAQIQISAHATTTSYLPNLHNVSTASLLSNCHLDKTKQGSMLSNRSNYGSQVNFKVSAKTPTNQFGDKSSSKKLSESKEMTDEEKIRRFRQKWEQEKVRVLKSQDKGDGLVPHLYPG